MLTQSEVEMLLSLIKVLSENKPIIFPNPGEAIQLEAISTSSNDKFLIDVNRKSQIKISKCTYQTRYKRSTILLRVDIDGPDHTNPDGEVVPCPHIHIYREGYEDKWAYPLEQHIQTNPLDLVEVLISFLRYNNINNIPDIYYQQGGLV